MHRVQLHSKSAFCQVLGNQISHQRLAFLVFEANRHGHLGQLDYRTVQKIDGLALCILYIFYHIVL